MVYQFTCLGLCAVWGYYERSSCEHSYTSLSRTCFYLEGGDKDLGMELSQGKHMFILQETTILLFRWQRHFAFPSEMDESSTSSPLGTARLSLILAILMAMWCHCVVVLICTSLITEHLFMISSGIYFLD